jgi:hypothetical protein
MILPAAEHFLLDALWLHSRRKERRLWNRGIDMIDRYHAPPPISKVIDLNSCPNKSGVAALVSGESADWHRYWLAMAVAHHFPEAREQANQIRDELEAQLGRELDAAEIIKVDFTARKVPRDLIEQSRHGTGRQ